MANLFYAAKSTRGFYSAEMSSHVPDDAVEITAELKIELLEGERAGRVIAWGDDGIPFLVDPQPPTKDELAAIERRWRDKEILISDGIVTRHRDECDMARITTLTGNQLSELLLYRQALRDWPQSELFPDPTRRPSEPTWLTTQTH